MKFPSLEDYEYFIQRFSDNISMRHPTTCFYIYGSFIREDFVPGRSDIDGGLILNSNFILPKQEVISLAKILNESLSETELVAGLSPLDEGISASFNLMDRATNRDGRFLAYDDTYADFLKIKAEIHAGPDFVREMCGLNYSRDSLRSAAFNLRKVRNGLLTHFLDRGRNQEKAERNILSSTTLLFSTPKKILETIGKELVFENGAFFQAFMEIFPEYNSRQYEKALSLRRSPQAYFGILNDIDGAFDMSIDFVNATEEMIKLYVKRFSCITQREVRTLSE
ncbi:hypothetical protein J4422_03350 [Candidatus Pacearchaeota archaeon]|nr:hypothetical protein [Candidatus Pacearchaeota archaeon]